MKPLRAALLAVAVLAALPAAAEEFSAGQKAEIEATIRAYLLANPEVIVEAMQALEERQKSDARAADKQRLAELSAAIFEDGFSHAKGAADADVTVVEFIDYRCPYCKRAHESVAALLEADPKVRVIVKEFPILGPESAFAARAAMAAQAQGGALYEAFGNAMMAHQGQLGEADVMGFAEAAGLDPARLRADMEAPQIAENIRKTYDLARRLEINGTPGFIIGGEIVRGFVPYEALREMVETARRAG